MVKNSSSQKGSAHVVIIVMLVVALLGALGFIFWQNFINKPATTNSATTQTASQQATTPAVSTPAYSLSDAAKEISSVLKTEACSGNGYADGVTDTNFRVVNNAAAFDATGAKSIINTSFTYAYVQYGCGRSGEIGLMKRDGSWKLIGEDARVYPMCDAIKNQGFPRAIVDKCYVNDSDTEATAI